MITIHEQWFWSTETDGDKQCPVSLLTNLAVSGKTKANRVKDCKKTCHNKKYTSGLCGAFTMAKQLLNKVTKP